MKSPKIPKNEKERQIALDSYQIVDSLKEQSFDDLTLIASQICDTPIALVSLIDNDRQWFKSKFGLDADETPRDISFCGHAINDPHKIFEVKDAKIDPRFSDNPLVSGDLNIGFYAGVPLIDSSNMALGTLCVIDQKPRELSENQSKALEAVARQVMERMEERKSNQSLTEKLKDKEIQLSDSSSKYSKLYHEAPDMMISVDPKTKKIVRCNNVVCDRLEYLQEELIGKDIFQIYDSECLEEAKLVLKEFVTTGRVQNKRLILKTKNDKKINISLNIKAVKNENGEVLYSNSILRDIDNLVEVENELRELNRGLELEIKKRSGELSFHKERLELALDGSRDAILDWNDIQSDKMWWSSRFHQMLGYERGEDIEQSMTFFRNLVHKEDAECVGQSINECITKGVPFDVEFRLKKKNGDFKWIRGRGNSVVDNQGNTYRMTGSITDIQDRKELEIELTKTKSFLQKVTSIAPSVIYVFDQQTMSNEYSNREISEILGYSNTEVQEMGDRLMPTLCHPDDLNLVFAHLEKITELEDNESVSIEYRMMHKDGQYVHLLSDDKVFERNEEGDVIKHIGVATDITDLKEGHLKLSKQSKLLKRQNEDLKQFAYVAMHDLKGPVTTIKGLFNHLKTQFINPTENRLEETTELISFVESELESFMSTVNGLTNAIEIREVDVEEEIVDFNVSIEEVLDYHRPTLEKLNGAFHVSLEKKVKVIGNHVYIKSIMTNLVSNAIKYSSPDRHPNIFISTRIEKDYVYFNIEDNGLGIDLNLQKDRVFKMFSQFHDRSKGTGMGLYMIKSMLGKIGGSVEVESIVNEGTIFSIKLKIGYEKV